ncbi:MAG: flagellar protein FlaG [Firmicutes bacterium]|nr:flagellar protein FlaG [Bacillota bacterium]
MSIELSNSDGLPRLDRSESADNSRLQSQEVRDVLMNTSEKVREVIEDQQADNQQLRDISREEIQRAADSVADMARTLNRELQFSVNNDIDETVVTVIDKNTGEMVRQIPSEEIVRLAQRMKEYSGEQLDSATGILLDSQA